MEGNRQRATANDGKSTVISTDCRSPGASAFAQAFGFGLRLEDRQTAGTTAFARRKRVFRRPSPPHFGCRMMGRSRQSAHFEEILGRLMSFNKPDSAPLPEAVRGFWVLSAGLTVLCAVVMFFNSHVLHLGYPYNLPFVHRLFAEQDFLCFYERFDHLHTLEFLGGLPKAERYMYPAPMVLLYKPFYMMGRHSLRLFFGITGFLCLTLAAMLGRTMIREGVRRRTTWLFLSFCLLTSYPFWFEYVLANMEICIFLMVAFAVLAFLRGHFYLAAGLIGVAGAMKIFPLIYMGLLLSRKKYRQMLFGIVFAGLLNVASLWIIYPSIAVSFHGIQTNLSAFRSSYMLRFLLEQTGFDHSLFGLFKSVARVPFHWLMPSAVLTGYLALACAGGVMLYFIRIRHLPLLNQILCLCIASILLPPTSHDYTLLHLYVPWGLLVIYAIQLEKDREAGFDLRPFFFCFAVLFSTESEFIVSHGRIGGQIKAVTLVVLIVLALLRPFPPLNEQARSVPVP